MHAVPGDYMYIRNSLAEMVDFMLVLMLVRCLHGQGVYDETWFSFPNKLAFANVVPKKSVDCIGKIVKSMRLNFWKTDPGTVAAQQVLTGSPGNIFQNSYLMTLLSTKTFAERLLRKRVCFKIGRAHV